MKQEKDSSSTQRRDMVIGVKKEVCNSAELKRPNIILDRYNGKTAWIHIVSNKGIARSQHDKGCAGMRCKTS